MTIYQILCLIGVPSVCTSLVGIVLHRMRESSKRTIALEKGVQALLRAQMVRDFNHYTKKGYAPLYAKQNFENCWKQYENLGENGVMCELHDEFMQFPTCKKGELNNENQLEGAH